MTIIGVFFKSMVETSKHLSHQKKQVPWQMSSGYGDSGKLFLEGGVDVLLSYRTERGVVDQQVHHKISSNLELGACKASSRKLLKLRNCSNSVPL